MSALPSPFIQVSVFEVKRASFICKTVIYIYIYIYTYIYIYIYIYG